MFPYLTLSESLAIPTYALWQSVVFVLGIYWVERRAAKGERSTKDALDLSLMIMVGGFFGARLFHIFYEEPSYYWQNPSEVFKFWKGGFVYLGGLLGAWVCAAVLARVRNLDFFSWADFFAPVFAIGYGVGRVGCFLNGCCYGKACPYFWGVTYPVSAGLGAHPLHPTQLYAFVWEITLGLVLIVCEKKRFRLFQEKGQLFWFWIALHSLGRMLMERFRGDFRGSEPLDISVSTWICLGLLLISVTQLAFRKKSVIP